MTSVSITILVVLFHCLGVLTATHAIRKAITPQGAVAWVFALFLFPYLSVFVYWIFGHHRDERYAESIKRARAAYGDERKRIADKLKRFEVANTLEIQGGADQAVPSIFRGLAQESSALRGNNVQLCIDGQETFSRMFQDIENASKRVLVSFYIIRSDKLGKSLKKLLIKKAKEGVEVCVLYDGLGSFWLPSSYVNELQNEGVKVQCFRSSFSLSAAFSLNYRSHRKLVVIDSKIGYVGGHNVGDEYRGKGKTFSAWRDTHVRLKGPAVQLLEATFAEDWYAVTKTPLDVLSAVSEVQESDTVVLPFSTGPVTVFEGCSFMFFDAVVTAKQRFWITTPYFVPDEAMCRALEHAALRGVDVRIMLPGRPENYLAWLAGHAYFEKMLQAGIRFYRYMEGFLHQKVFLVDDWWSCVGSANLDNRSFRLNFETSILVFDKEFSASVEEMLLADFERCQEITVSEVNSYSMPFVISASAARLCSPML